MSYQSYDVPTDHDDVSVSLNQSASGERSSGRVAGATPAVSH
jgi:hypothetical protein